VVEVSPMEAFLEGAETSAGADQVGTGRRGLSGRILSGALCGLKNILSCEVSHVSEKTS